MSCMKFMRELGNCIFIGFEFNSAHDQCTYVRICTPKVNYQLTYVHTYVYTRGHVGSVLNIIYNIIDSKILYIEYVYTCYTYVR